MLKNDIKLRFTIKRENKYTVSFKACRYSESQKKKGEEEKKNYLRIGS